MKKKISIICPAYNEEDNINNCYQKLSAVIDRLNQYEFEFIFTDNHSEDNTFQLLQQIANMDSRVKVYRFSRNYGYQNSIMTGYQLATGDAAISFDVDLQDPPEMLIIMLEKWEKGYAITYGIREKRKEHWLVNRARQVFYAVMNKISDSPLPPNAGDFMLIDRKIIDLLVKNSEKCLYIRGLIFGYGFSQIGIPYTREKRFAGNSKFPLGKMFNLALDGVVNQSAYPLQFMFYAGITGSVISTILIFLTLVAKIMQIFPYPIATASIILLVLLSISVNTLFLGLLGIYVARIFVEIKNRPLTIIEEKIEKE